jgi:hypothetical protein
MIGRVPVGGVHLGDRENFAGHVAEEPAVPLLPK